MLVAAGIGSVGLLGLGDILIPRKGQMVVTDRAAAGRPAIDTVSKVYSSPSMNSSTDNSRTWRTRAIAWSSSAPSSTR